MPFSIHNTQLQYQGFLATPLLWKGRFMSVEQLELPPPGPVLYTGAAIKNIRLGKRAEQFAFHYFRQLEGMKVLAQNIQLKKNKVTIGELDALLDWQGQFIHLEMVCKFYLYDTSAGTSEIERWIGPNRKDSLIRKLKKLKNHQLPLLFSDEAVELLKKLQISPASVQQKVFFKAQLFVPTYLLHQDLPLINNDCIAGCYIHWPELEQLHDHQFSIPDKMDWLVAPHPAVEWLPFDEFKAALAKWIANKSAPLCWLKTPGGSLQKFFVVWW